MAAADVRSELRSTTAGVRTAGARRGQRKLRKVRPVGTVIYSSNMLHATCGGSQTELRRGIHIGFYLSFNTPQ